MTTEIRENNGTTTIRRFNQNRYTSSETYDADSEAPVMFDYERDGITNVMGGATISCLGQTGRMTQRVKVTPLDVDAKQSLAQELCVPRK